MVPASLTRPLAALAGAAVLWLAGAVPAARAQIDVGSPAVHGVWNPVVGAGSVYEVQAPGGRTREVEIAVVGTDTIDGKPGYWLQIATAGTATSRGMTSESLLAGEGEHTEVKRLLVQRDGQPPYEMPPSMRQQHRLLSHIADIRKQAERVGSEEVDTPAGTFTCEHYRTRDGAVDVWVSAKVVPWGIVKTQGQPNLTLVRQVSGATRRITGTPQVIDPAKLRPRPPAGSPSPPPAAPSPPLEPSPSR